MFNLTEYIKRNLVGGYKDGTWTESKVSQLCVGYLDKGHLTVEDIEEIDELIGKELPEGDYETLAGFIMDELQCIPKNGEMNEVVFENVKFTVLSVEDRRIEKIKVEITPVEETIDEDDED